MLADRALADLRVPSSPVAWQTALLDFFTGMYDLLVASPAVAAIIAQQAVAGRQFRTHADHLVARLLDAGFSADTAVEAVVALAQFTLGASLPGTGQRLYDTYRTRQRDIDREGLRALSLMAHRLATDDAAGRFRAALRRLIRAYEEP